ncbi:MAG: hypothetical protein ACTSX6_11090 [Candidatus Heimdallarchaeaceae archaeon]
MFDEMDAAHAVGIERFPTEERPNFGPRQVRTLEGIKPGNIFKKVGLAGTGSESLILIISEPFPKIIGDDKLPSMRFEYLVLRGCMKGWLDGAFAADKSVIPYLPGNVWNNSNYLLRTGRKRLTEKQIAEKISKYFTKDSIDCRKR